jgi:hypothetical protein
LGSGNALVLGGGTLNTTGLNQAMGTLTLSNSSTIDFGAGATALTFNNSSSIDWGGSTLTILDWTLGSDTLRFGTDASGLTAAELGDIVFADLGNAAAQIDANGFVTPVAAPEPSVAALGLLGGLTLTIGLARRRSRR